MTKFNFFENELLLLIQNEDTESAHIQADAFICQIALAASKAELSPDETQALIDLYSEVDKWYA